MSGILVVSLCRDLGFGVWSLQPYLAAHRQLGVESETSSRPLIAAKRGDAGAYMCGTPEIPPCVTRESSFSNGETGPWEIGCSSVHSCRHKGSMRY